MSEAVLRNYLRKIERAYQIGNATEHTYRSALQELLETLVPDLTVTNEPKRVKCGAPDFIVTKKQICSCVRSATPMDIRLKGDLF